MKIAANDEDELGSEESSDGGVCDVCKKMRRRERYLWS